MKIKNLLCSIIAFGAVFCFNHAHADELSRNIFVSNAWVRAMPPSQTMTAAYMTIVNNSPQEVVIVSTSSAVAGAAEIHQMNESNGMMHMAMRANLHVPAQGRVALQPGGYHIMLIGLKKPLKAGDMVPITFHFRDGSSMTVEAKVKKEQEDNSSNMPAMKM